MMLLINLHKKSLYKNLSSPTLLVMANRLLWQLYSFHDNVDGNITSSITTSRRLDFDVSMEKWAYIPLLTNVLANLPIPCGGRVVWLLIQGAISIIITKSQMDPSGIVVDVSTPNITLYSPSMKTS